MKSGEWERYSPLLDGMVFASGWGFVRGLEEQVGECAKQGDRQSNSDDAATS
jgi:hypothetical protein